MQEFFNISPYQQLNGNKMLTIWYHTNQNLYHMAVYKSWNKEKDYRGWIRLQMASLSFHTIHVLVFCAYLLISTSSRSLPHQPKKHATLFIFGDSLYDAGNNNYINTTTDYQANFWPYGETFFGYPAGRFLDGRLIPDFIGKRVVQYVVVFSIWVNLLPSWCLLLFCSWVCKIPTPSTISTTW